MLYIRAIVAIYSGDYRPGHRPPDDRAFFFEVGQGIGQYMAN
jgi:hypothetical protein